MPFSHYLQRDNGTPNRPAIDSPWTDWTSASKSRNWCMGDPLLDWLALHGAANGFQKDSELPTYDARCDNLDFLLKRGIAFEEAVVEWLSARHSLVVAASGPGDSQSEDAARRTWDAMSAGAEIVSQAVLWNPENQTYGMADLLIRSDVLHRLFPDSISETDAATAAPGIPGARWHYRVVDVKFTTLQLDASCGAASDHVHYMAQIWLYNEALGRIQGWLPPCGYLLGRGWKQGTNGRGNSAFDRLARVDHDREFKNAPPLAVLAADAVAWYQRVRHQGAGWAVLPSPSIDELRPNLRENQDAPWHAAKRKIAHTLEDLTMIPRVNPKMRETAISVGISRWSDQTCTVAALGFKDSASTTPQVDAVLRANQSQANGPIVFPSRLAKAEPAWRAPAPVEFFVDFETVTDLDDDFSMFPMKGGQSLIFMVGIGWLDIPGDIGSWRFQVFTTDSLTAPEERRIITEWLDFAQEKATALGSSLEQSRFYHWSPAETSFLSNAYNAASRRHGLPAWNDLPWFDLLTNVIKAEPVGVRGAWGFGLKAVAKAMHQAGLITTNWTDGPADGLGAMTGAWWCHHEATRTHSRLPDLDLMKQIESYNEIDCKAMADILWWLRKNR